MVVGMVLGGFPAIPDRRRGSPGGVEQRQLWTSAGSSASAALTSSAPAARVVPDTQRVDRPAFPYAESR